jgi:hypothetical protein
MPSGYFTMWGMLILIALGASFELWSQGGPTEWYHAAYPSDPEHQDALRRCSENDNQFSRFSFQNREDCYRTMLHDASTSMGDGR